MIRRSARLFPRGIVGMLVVLIAASTAAAQTPAPSAGTSTGKKVSFGVVGGVTVAHMTLPVNIFPGEIDPGLPPITLSSGSRTGFVVGVSAAIPLRGRFAGESGLIISSKGAGIDMEITGIGTANGALRLTYLDVPFLARIEAARFSRSTLYIVTGPSMGINLSARAAFSALGQSASEPIPDFPRMDFGWVGGGRLAFQRLQFEVRYEHGLKELSGDPSASVKNRTWSMLAGLRF